MALPKSLEEWYSRLSSAQKRIIQMRSIIKNVSRLESSAGDAGVLNWPIDATANDLMRDALLALKTELDDIIAASYYYKFTITEGRPEGYWSTSLVARTMGNTPRQYILANPDRIDIDGTLPFEYAFFPTIPQKVSFRITNDHGDVTHQGVIDQASVAHGYDVNGYAPACPPQAEAAADPIGANGRGIDIDAIENLRLLNETYDLAVVADTDRAWEIENGWTHTATGTVIADGAIYGGNVEALNQHGSMMRYPTIQDVVYQVTLELDNVAAVSSPLYLNVVLDAAFDGIWPGVVTQLDLNPGGGIVPGDFDDTQHAFYITAPANSATLQVNTNAGVAGDTFEIKWIRMTPVLGQILGNGCFYTTEPAHIIGTNGAGAPAFVTGESERWQSTSSQGGGDWYIATGNNYVYTNLGHTEILYMAGARMLAEVGRSPLRYVVEYSMMVPAPGGLDRGVQPVFGTVVPGTIAPPVPNRMTALDGYGDPTFCDTNDDWYRFRQIITGPNRVAPAGGFDFAFLPVRRGVVGLNDFYGRIADVVIYPYLTEDDGSELVPDSGYTTETTLVDKI